MSTNGSAGGYKIYSRKSFWSDPYYVSKSPLFSTAVFEYANVSQIIRMWTEHTAAGQSLLAWIAVCAGLCLYWNFYRVITPDEKVVRWMSCVGLIANIGVILSVIYWRFLA